MEDGARFDDAESEGRDGAEGAACLGVAGEAEGGRRGRGGPASSPVSWKGMGFGEGADGKGG